MKNKLKKALLLVGLLCCAISGLFLLTTNSVVAFADAYEQIEICDDSSDIMHEHNELVYAEMQSALTPLMGCILPV